MAPSYPQTMDIHAGRYSGTSSTANVDGTASQPSIAFGDDQDTGIYSPNDNKIAFTVAGAQAVCVDSDGIDLPSGKVIKVNGSTILTATGFTGTATTATTATNVTVADESSDTTCFPLFTISATGNLAPKSGSNLTFNSSSGLLTATSFAGASTTQSAGDNSTKLATTAYVDTATAALVDSAPSNLNTLNELAAALNDDADLANTVNTSIATKLPLAGGQMTGNITFSGSQTVDGRDVSADGSKLDGIATSANAYTHPNHSGDVTSSADGATTIANDAVTGAKIADNAIDSEHYTDGSIDTAHIANDAVDGTKLANNIDIAGSLDVTNGITSDNTVSIINTSANPTLALQSANNGTCEIKFGDAADTVRGNIIYLNGTAGEKLQFNGYNNTERLNIDSSGNVNIPNDTGKLRLGTSNDLELFHDGSYSYIKNSHAGGLWVSSDLVAITNGATSENMAKFIADGAVELYYNHSKKFETTSDGITLSGWMYIPDSDGSDNMIRLGNGADLKLYHDPSDSYIQNETGVLRINNDGTDLVISTDDNVHIRTNGTEEAVKCVGNAQVELYYDNSKKLNTESWGVEVVGTLRADVLNLLDDEKIKIGAASDLEIYHDGSNSYIDSDGGDLYIDTNSGHAFRIKTDQFNMKNAANNETLMSADNGGAVSLYYDNSLKIETTSTGISMPAGTRADFNGNVKLVDSSILYIGTGNDLQLYHDATDSFITNSTGKLRIYGSGSDNILIRAKNDEEGIIVKPDGGIELYHNNSKKFETISNGFKTQGSGQTDICVGSTDAGGAYIILDGDSNGDFSGSDYAYLAHNTVGDLEVVARRPSGGNSAVIIKAYDGSANSLGTAFVAAHDAVWSYHAMYPWTDNNRDLGYSGRRWDDIWATNGSIETSDRNAKENITNTDLGLSFINKLTPKSFKRKGKTRTHYGLVAQDVETVLSDISKPTSGFAGFIKADVPVEYYTEYDESIPEGKSIGDVKKDAHTTYGLRYGEFISPIIKSIQELNAKDLELSTNQINFNSDVSGVIDDDKIESKTQIQDGIRKIKALNSYQVTLKGDAKIRDGFVSSDVKTIYGREETSLIPTLTAALSEAIAKIEALEAKVSALEAG